MTGATVAVAAATQSCLITMLVSLALWFALISTGAYFIVVQGQMLGLLQYHFADRLDLVSK